MIEYIYFVKCPGCEDEHFDFFEEAKAFALGCLSQKPIITQIEVDRNDFGECRNSADLGTVWSWEDMMDNRTDDEPAISIFTKDDLTTLRDADPEFDAIDNSLDCAPDNFKKPIPEGMTLKELVEEMEERENTVECAGCEELFDKDDCVYKDGIGWLCGDCEDTIVKCTWCEELFDRSECRYEVDLGWLCDRCEAAIKSRGETLTFREVGYWDFLDEKLDPEALHDLGNEYDGEYPADSELEDTDTYLARLVLCPECGKTTLDPELSMCSNCGAVFFDEESNETPDEAEGR